MTRSPVLLLSLLIVATIPSTARPSDPAETEVRQTFERFVVAQNAHDPRAVKELLWEGAGFLWITRGNVIWGRDAALQRFEANYAGTWKLEPDMSQFRVTVLGDGTAALFVPLVVTAGPAGQPSQALPFHMNQVLVRTADGWKIARILPIPLPKS